MQLLGEITTRSALVMLASFWLDDAQANSGVVRGSVTLHQPIRDAALVVFDPLDDRNTSAWCAHDDHSPRLPASARVFALAANASTEITMQGSGPVVVALARCAPAAATTAAAARSSVPQRFFATVPLPALPLIITQLQFAHLAFSKHDAAQLPASVAVDLLLANPRFGRWSHFAADQVDVPPLMATYAFAVAFCLLPVQARRVAQVWTWDGVPAAIAVFVVLILETGSAALGLVEVAVFCSHGVYRINYLRPSRAAADALEAAASLVLLGIMLCVAEGLLLDDPRMARPRRRRFAPVLGAVAACWLVAAVAAAVVDAAQLELPPGAVTPAAVSAGLQVCLFVVVYADLVRLMRTSRLHPGQKSRGESLSCALRF